ncbi:hypothetical protein ACPPVT_19245 [Angustibacter sp. McL0619]|uniref:hypothetical protein n=1 Tax=Angustibacter sp. McL0619 TaxID=3415676 RepID=UPI003CED2005
MPRSALAKHLLVAVAGAATLALLVACTDAADQSSDPTKSGKATATPAPVSFVPCGQARCTGSINGAKYEIQLPARWNGTLLLYSHGYVEAAPIAPDFATPTLAAESSPDDDIAHEMLAEGYALAGSSFSRLGWAVPEGVKADEELYAYFAAKVAKPRQVIVWGNSMGAVITEGLAEKKLAWVTAAAPMCGPLAGTNETLDLSLDVAYAVRTLLAPKLQIAGFTSHKAAVHAWESARKALEAAGNEVAAGDTAGPAKLYLISALIDAPDQSFFSDGSDSVLRAGVAVEDALHQMSVDTDVRYDIERRAGASVSGNAGVDYATRISPAERTFVDETGGPGTTDRLLAKLAAGQRVSADKRARAAAGRTMGEPTAALSVPTTTLHTAKDPVAIVQHEQLFAQRAQRAGSQNLLLQLYSVPPAKYDPPPKDGGAGHCNLTAGQVTATVALLSSWAATHTRPTDQEVTAAASKVPSLSGTFVPAPWPDPRATGP